ncbi:MAG: hypothetical protein JEZ02_21880 [Desulfatibacillum sp.]|nr:hypothetical protein [Desulfatibacillum sp.]
MPYFHIDNATLAVIQKFLSDQNLDPWVRVEIQFTGCCDASLGLVADKTRETDLSEKHGDVWMVMDPDTYQTVGMVSITHTKEEYQDGFFLKSERPLNEWAGFAPCAIIIR